MTNENARRWDRVKLILAALAVIGLIFGVMTLFDRIKGLAYVLALVILLVWPFVALWMVQLRGIITAAFAYSIYILLLAYLVGHTFPFRGVAGWLDKEEHHIIDIVLGIWLGVGWVWEKIKGGSQEPISSRQITEV